MKKITLPLLFAVFAVFQSSSLFSQDNNERLIKDYISQNKIREYKKSDLMNFSIDLRDRSESMNADIIKIQQVYNNIPVYGSVGSILMRDNRIIYFNDNFEKDYGNADASGPHINKEEAFKFAAKNVNLDDPSKIKILDFFDADTQDMLFAKSRLVYTKKDQDLILCYEFVFPEKKTSNYWNILVNATTGEIVQKNNLNLSCSFNDHPYEHSSENSLVSFPIKEDNSQRNVETSLLLSPDNASYNVFPFPIEAPTFGARSVVTNPWILASSPEGWHSDGTTHYTNARGNNVFAYQDLYDDDLFTGVTVDGGVSRNFNFPYDPNAHALLNKDAAITNLFYANNKVHDVFYKFGFTETARNFQKNNFGLGGAGNDFVNAEAQDGAGTPVTPQVSNYNNANFATPPDGGSGRMQMYLWLKNTQKLFYNTPASAVSRTPTSFIAQFGQQITGVPVTGEVKLSPVLDACTALPANSLNGFIGLAERGNCDFGVKVENMQNAGATAAIIYNAVNSAAPGNMGGNNTNIFILSELIDNAEGEYIKSQLASNVPVNVSMNYNVKQDGSFDNGIMIHEYGHGISNRLTGDGYSCLNATPYSGNTTYSKEQMGEGWSDFFALMLTNKPGDNASVARGMATYAAGQATNGAGIRPAKYSPDFLINDFTYDDTNGMEFNTSSGLVPDVHSIGFVWATMLWDLHWQYVAKYGYSSDVTASTTSGSARVLRLVTDALKLQACDPTFIDGRNAILAAELATTGGEDKCMIWRTFAKRGLGVNASAGVKTNINDQLEDFTVPAECPLLATDEVKSVKNTSISIYPNPAKNEFFINFPSNTMGKVSVEIYDMSGKLVSSEDKISPDAKKAISTDRLINGTYMVKVKGLGFEAASKVIVKK